MNEETTSRDERPKVPYIIISGRTTSITADPNTMVTLVGNNASLGEPDPASPCSITGRPGLRVLTHTSMFNLTPELTRAMLLKSLQPLEVRILRSRSPDEFWVNHNLYNESCMALQPALNR